MNKKYISYLVFICTPIIGFICGFCLFESKMDEKYYNYVYPYENYELAWYGDTVKYNIVVEERRTKTPSHPDYLDLSLIMACKYHYLPAYYNAYLALHDLYKYNHFEMGDDVKRLMYSYLQLAIESNDSRVTKDDVRNYRMAFPEGIVVERIARKGKYTENK